jgi:hypothetical protein
MNTKTAPRTTLEGYELLDRIGRFRISRELIRRNPAELLPLFAEMVVVEAQMRWEYDSIEYVALSERRGGSAV